MGKQFTTDSPTIEEIMRDKKPYRRTVDIPMDPEVSQSLAEKEDEIERLEQRIQYEKNRQKTDPGKSLAERDKTAEIQKQIDEMNAELDEMWEQAQDSVVTFTFEDIGRKRYDDLVNEHPPTPEQKKSWEESGQQGSLGYNVETFPPVLIAATCIQPKMTVEQAEKLFEEWGNGDVIRLYTAAEAVCLGAAKVPKSRRSLLDIEPTTSSDSNSTSASS